MARVEIAEGARCNTGAACDRTAHMRLQPGDVVGTDFIGIDGIEGEVKQIMLELRPTCEHCNAALPPDSVDARICSFECTFCASCVDELLDNVCPNCGGGFVVRPVRPARNLKGDNYLGKFPASEKPKHRPVDLPAHARFAATIAGIRPEQR